MSDKTDIGFLTVSQVRSMMKVGHVGIYLKDYPFEVLEEISGEEAIRYAREVAPDAKLGPNGEKVSNEAFNEETWMNKAFLITESNGDGVIAIDKCDGKFFLMVAKEESRE